MAYNTKFYTKHYNIESDRVVSKIGGRFEYSPYPISEHLYNNDIQSLSDNQNKSDSIFLSMMPQHFDSAYVYDDVVVDMISLKNIYSLTLFYKNENDIFWYHKDQLGSSTQITDVNEMVIHHIEYMPYGEAFVEQRSNWGTNYKFNGKELDEETGFYYYGARYYTPELSIWLSVDPLSDKFSSTSPYMYVLGNPLKLIDPNGMDTAFADNHARTDFNKAKHVVDSKVNELTESLNSDKISDRKRNKLSKELKKWSLLKDDFDYICDPNTPMVTYSTNVSKLKSDRSGITIQKWESKNSEVTITSVEVFIRPGKLSTYIHENRHTRQNPFMSTVDSEIEAFEYQKIFSPNDVQTIINNARRDKYPNNGAINPDYMPSWGIREMVNYIYGDE